VQDESLSVIYFNERVTDQQWTTFEVGHTTFNDEALRQAAEMTIYNMRNKRPAYNLISNNCQTFALSLLDAIQIGKHREFGYILLLLQLRVAVANSVQIDICDIPASDRKRQDQGSVRGGTGT
jgi:hypothetical protein